RRPGDERSSRALPAERAVAMGDVADRRADAVPDPSAETAPQPFRCRIGLPGRRALRRQGTRPSLSRQRTEALPLVEMSDAFVAPLDFEIERSSSDRRGERVGRLEQCTTDPLAATVRKNVELVEPCGSPRMFERPKERKRRESNDPSRLEGH